MKRILSYIIFLIIFTNAFSLSENIITFYPGKETNNVSLLSTPQMDMIQITPYQDYSKQIDIIQNQKNGFGIKILANREYSDIVADKFKEFRSIKNHLVGTHTTYYDLTEGYFFAKLNPFDLVITDNQNILYFFKIPSLYLGLYQANGLSWLLGAENTEDMSGQFVYSDTKDIEFVSADGLSSVVFSPINEYGPITSYNLELRKKVLNNTIKFNATGLSNKVINIENPKMDIISINEKAKFFPNPNVQHVPSNNSIDINMEIDKIPSDQITNDILKLMNPQSGYLFYSEDRLSDNKRFKEIFFLIKLTPFKITLASSDKEFFYNMPSLYLGKYSYGNDKYSAHEGWVIGAEENAHGNGHFIINKDGYLEFLADNRLSCVVFKPENENSLDINSYNLEVRESSC